MKFEEALSEVRNGKCAQMARQPCNWAYIKADEKGDIAWRGFFWGKPDWNYASYLNLDDRKLNTEWVIVDEDEVRSRLPVATHNCGRRGESFRRDTTPIPGEFFDWYSTERGYRSCSYCGGMHQDDFMELVRTRAGTIVPTDKSYKAYLRYAEAEPHKKFISGTTSTKGDTPPGPNWVRATEELLDSCDSHSSYTNPGDWVLVRERGPTREDKFYFQHLTKAQQTELIDLVNNRSIQFAHPGFFYTTPYFATPVKEKD